MAIWGLTTNKFVGSPAAKALGVNPLSGLFSSPAKVCGRELVLAKAPVKLLLRKNEFVYCAALPALAATAEGYDAYVLVDASGTFSATKREAGLLRMQQAGVILTDYATAMVEILADNAAPAAGAVYADLAMPFAVLVGQISDAYRK